MLALVMVLAGAVVGVVGFAWLMGRTTASRAALGTRQRTDSASAASGAYAAGTVSLPDASCNAACPSAADGGACGADGGSAC
jgi:hypothetical protein